MGGLISCDSCALCVQTSGRPKIHTVAVTNRGIEARGGGARGDGAFNPLDFVSAARVLVRERITRPADGNEPVRTDCILEKQTLLILTAIRHRRRNVVLHNHTVGQATCD